MQSELVGLCESLSMLASFIFSGKTKPIKTLINISGRINASFYSSKRKNREKWNTAEL